MRADPNMSIPKGVKRIFSNPVDIVAWHLIKNVKSLHSQITS